MSLKNKIPWNYISIQGSNRKIGETKMVNVEGSNGKILGTAGDVLIIPSELAAISSSLQDIQFELMDAMERSEYEGDDVVAVCQDCYRKISNTLAIVVDEYVQNSPHGKIALEDIKIEFDTEGILCLTHSEGIKLRIFQYG